MKMKPYSVLVLIVMALALVAALQSEQRAETKPTSNKKPITAKKKVVPEVALPNSPAIRVWGRNVKAKKLSANSPEKPLVVYSPNRENIAFGDELIIPAACKDLMVVAKLEKTIKRPATICIETFDSKKRGRRESFTFTFAGETSEIILQFRFGRLFRVDMLKPNPRTLYPKSPARSTRTGLFYQKYINILPT
jgi:hypothetical protein